MGDHVIATAAEIGPGCHCLVEVEGSSIRVFNVDGELVAYENRCQHQFGPVCSGAVSGRYDASFDTVTLSTTYEWSREGEILSCPWHGWECDLRSEDCLAVPTVSLRSFEVHVEDGDVVVTV